MTKPEIIALISQRAEITKKAAGRVLGTFVEAVHSSLQGNNGKIRIAALGTFRVVEMEPRRGVNPRTGKEMTIPAMRLPRFTAAKALKQVVRKGK